MRKSIVLAMVVVLILAMAVVSSGTVALLNAVGNTPSQWTGLSTDVKPTTVAYGSTFYAENSGILYMYGTSGWVPDNRNLGGVR